MSISGKILTTLESEVLAKVGKYRRWNVIDGRCYSVYGLSKESRDKFIPDSISGDFKTIDKFAIRAFDFHGSAEQLQHCKDSFCSDFRDVSVLGINLQNDDRCEAFFIGRDREKSNLSESNISVNDRASIVAGKKMLLTNVGKQHVSPFSNDRGVIFKSHSGGKDIWLKSSESVLLQFELEDRNRIWREIGRSVTQNVHFDVNPLVRESGPVFQQTENEKSIGLNAELDGELFLPLHVIEKLLFKKISTINKPFFQWLCTSCDLQMKAFFEIIKVTAEERKEGMLACLVYEHLPVHHTMVTTLYVKEDRVYCYLHETLGFENKLAGEIRDKLVKTIKFSFCDHSIVFMTPKEAMQKDFSVCGVFAIKMMQFVAKNPEQWTSFLVKSRVRKPTSEEIEIKSISVRDLPPAVLKMCQDTNLPSPKQKNTVIGHKKYWDLTLAQYWEAYGYKGKKSLINHAALTKLFKYYADYAALKEEAGKSKVQAAGAEQRPGSRAADKRTLRDRDNSLYQSGPKKVKVCDVSSGRTVYISMER